MKRYKQARRFWRRIAPLVAFVFVVSSLPQRARAVNPPHALSIAVESGSTFPWEGNVSGANTGNGNKLTPVRLFGWTARGGLPVEVALYHNSQGNHNSELGYKWTFSFDIYMEVDGSGNPTVHWGNDLAVAFTLNQDGSYTPRTGIHDALVANGSPISSYDLKTPGQVTYHFTNPNGTGWYCASIADRNGNTLTIAHNGLDYVTSVTDPTSRTLSFTYDGNNRISAITDCASRQWSLSYTSGNLTQITWPTVGGTTPNMQFGYNANHCITSLTDLRGNTSSAAYFSDNSLNWEQDPLGNRLTYGYTSGQTTITDSNSHVVKHNYSSGRLSSVVDALNNTESYSYDSSNNRTGVTDRRGNSSSATFDAAGNTLTITDPLSHTTTWTYNSRNDVLTVTDALNHTVTNTYTNAGNLATTTDALSHQTAYSWDANGLLQSVTDPLNHSTLFYYDSHGNLTSTTDANNSTTSWSYNTLGVKTGETDPLGTSTTYTLDGWYRTTAVAKGGNTLATTTYDANGNTLTVTDGNSHTTTMAYDANNRLTSRTNARNDVVGYSYDATGKKGLLSSWTDGNNHTTTLSYNARNEKTGVVYSDSSSESFGFDANGNPTSHTDRKGVTIYRTFDAANRLTLIDYPTGTDTALSYDAANRRTGMTDRVGTWTWSFDAANRTTSLAAPNGTVSWAYDNANRVTTRTLSGTGDWSYTYDAGNRVTAVANPFSETQSVSYNAANLPTQVTAGNGSTTAFSYDALLRTTDVWHKTSGNATIARTQYAYDAASNVYTRTDDDGSTTTFGYDAANQVTGETRSTPNAYTIAYAYDGNGNRTSKTVGGVQTNYSYDSHDHLTAAGGKTYAYDANGNCTSVTLNNLTTSLSWTYDNRLAQITYPDNSTNTFQYNGMGLRTQRVDSSGTRNYVCDRASPASTVLADGSAVYSPSSERRSGVSRFRHPDALGSTRAITSAAQATTDAWLHDAFGMTVARTGTTATPFGFAGGHEYQSDGDNGLMLLGNRYYDPSIGRFISSDPAEDGTNWYAYCGNNPVGAVDPEGLSGVFTIIREVLEITNRSRRLGRPVGVRAAVRIVRGGGNIIVGGPGSRRVGKGIAQRVWGPDIVEHLPISHKQPADPALPHYQPAVRGPDGHVYVDPGLVQVGKLVGSFIDPTLISDIIDAIEAGKPAVHAAIDHAQDRLRDEYHKRAGFGQEEDPSFDPMFWITPNRRR